MTKPEQGETDSFDTLLRKVAHVSSPAPGGQAMLTVGERVADGRLSLSKKLGEGGMGVVYEAFDAQRRAKVARVLRLSGKREAAIEVLRDTLRTGPYPVVRAFARHELGRLLGGDEGEALVADAEAFLRDGGCVDPARLVSLVGAYQ